MEETQKLSSTMTTRSKRATTSDASSGILLNARKSLRPAKEVWKSEPNPIVEIVTPDLTGLTDHYLLKEIKGDQDENEIDFVLTKKRFEEGAQPAECREEIENWEEGGEIDDDDGNVNTKEIVEHVCGKCYKSFRTIKVLKRHMEYCIFNSDMVIRRAEMQNNIEKIEKEAIIMEKKDLCFCCGDSYDICHLGHINCTECPKTFKTQISLERHIFLVHSEHNDFPCDVCNGRIRTESLLKLHKDQHKNRGKPFACKQCGKDFTRQYHLKRHHKYSLCGNGKAEMMQCKVCGKEFYRLDNLRVHLKSHLGQGTPKKPEYTCPCCKKCFYSLSTLNIHIRTHTGERPFDCDLCEKNFPSLVSLKKHRRYHTGEKPYTCEVCQQTFAVKEVLNRHMKRHTGQKPHVCTQCDKRFIQATQLKNHLRTHLRPYECTICPEKFKTEKQFEKHFRLHTKKTNRTQKQCIDCNLVFKSHPLLLRHLKSAKHIENAVKTCVQCGEKCSNTKSLEFHMLKEHTNNCGYCSMSFVQFSLLEEHMKTAHNDTTGPKDETKPTKVEPVKTEDQNCFIIEEYIVDSLAPGFEPPASSVQDFTIIAIDNQVSPEFEKVKNVISKKTPDLRAELKKSLANCLQDEAPKRVTEKAMNEEDVQISEKVGRLLDMLVDVETLVKFGWPEDAVENVLCKVIENCGYNLYKTKFTEDYGTRMREFVKLLFTVVIQNDSIKELLNNFSIDEVIDYVLSNDDDD